MIAHYGYDDALYQVVKALLVRIGDAAETDVGGPFEEVTIKISTSELRRTDDYSMTVQVHNALDDVIRSVTLRLRRNEQSSVEVIGVPDPREEP